MSALQNNVDALREQLAKQEALLEQQKREAIEKEEGNRGRLIWVFWSEFINLKKLSTRSKNS